MEIALPCSTARLMIPWRVLLRSSPVPLADIPDISVVTLRLVSFKRTSVDTDLGFWVSLI
jgi:hypothetical protein